MEALQAAGVRVLVGALPETLAEEDQYDVAAVLSGPDSGWPDTAWMFYPLSDLGALAIDAAIAGNRLLLQQIGAARAQR